MGSVDDALPWTALTLARRPCLHFHCAFWFPRQRARAHVALLGPCFKTGRTRPSEYQQHWHTSGTHRHGLHCMQSTSHGSLVPGGPAIRRVPLRARAAHLPRSGRSAVRQVCKLSARGRSASTHLPLSPCGSGLTAAGPCSRGVRHCLGRTARDDPRRRVGTLGRA